MLKKISVPSGVYRSLAVHSLQMSPSGKLRPDAAVAQAKKLLPVEIRDRTISAMEKCRSVGQGKRYVTRQYT